MNWGASYLVNDLYKRFLNPNATDAQLMRASRLASGIVLLLGGAVSYYMVVQEVKIDMAWQFLLALGAGVGAVFILRWFWWRINAWSEITAMVGSIGFYALFSNWGTTAELPTEYRSLLVATSTLGVWLLVTFLTPPEPQSHLQAFYRKIRPDGPGWGPIARTTPDIVRDGLLGRGILCAVLGTTVVWLTLPGIGAVIFGEMTKAMLCLGGAALAGFLLMRLVGRSNPTAPISG